MSDAFAPAIAALERKLNDLERKANELRSAINVLCAEGGLPPRYPDGGGSSGGPQVLAQIKPDTFYGKPLATGVREILEMRKIQGVGPATPREIFDVLKLGGFQFEAKNDEVSLVSLRATLRKNNKVFHRLPSGTYGLLSWYPNAKPPKDPPQQGGGVTSSSMDSDDEGESQTEQVATAASNDTAVV